MPVPHRHLEPGQAARHRADDGDAVTREVGDRRDRGGDDHEHQRAREPAPVTQREQHDDRRDAERSVATLVPSATSSQFVHDLVGATAVRHRHAGHRSELRAHEEDADRGEEARHHGLGQEAHDEPEAEHADRDVDDADEQRERRRQRDEALRAARRQLRDADGRQDRDRREWSDAQLSGPAEHRVHDERDDGRVQADHRWELGDRRVRHRLRDEDRRASQARDEIAGEVRALVARQPLEHGEPPAPHRAVMVSSRVQSRAPFRARHVPRRGRSREPG